MKKLMTSTIVVLLLATAVRANQESEITYERLTLKPDVQIQFNANTKGIIIRKIQMLDNLTNYTKVFIEVETVDNKGIHATKTYEKSLEGGHGQYYEMITEDKKVKAKIRNRQEKIDYLTK